MRKKGWKKKKENRMKKKSKGEQDAQRDWILKYMEPTSSNQDSDEEGVDPLEDYDVWSDPREVERRKQERKKGELPLEVRQKLIAEELVKMKQMAADAKAEKDKTRQKEAGSRIPKLKSEMAEIGMTDAMVEALVKPQEAEEALENIESPAVDSQENFDPAEGSMGALNLNEPEATQENSEEDFSFGFPGFDDEEDTEPVEDVNLKEHIEKSEEKSNPAEDEKELAGSLLSIKSQNSAVHFQAPFF
ncbi:hypothetical protein BSKO_10936 [Bryopsis sp. KO-2023]|nr:hypothetical protein BSKO_10936 [Bryopsis sp. KO-2023]